MIRDPTAPGAIVIVHVVNPTEKFWGVLERLDPTGIVIRALSVDSFDSWMLQVAKGEPTTLGLSTMYVPLFRIERIFLDETIGEVESYRRRFESRVGMPIEPFLSLADDGESEVPS